MHRTLPIYFKLTWTRTQANAKAVFSLQWQGVASSRDDRDVLRLAPRASSWAHKAVADSRRERCILKLEQDQHPAHL